MRKALDFIVYTNIWVALAVVSLTSLTGVILGSFSLNLIYFSFFATLLMYAYARWFEAPSREDEPVSNLTAWISGNKILYITSGIIGVVGAIYFVVDLQKSTLIWLIICGGVSAMYPLQFLTRRRVGLRNVAGLKLFIISAIWAIVTTVLPALENNESWSFTLFFLTLQRFLFVMAITIPFDIRDLRIDHPDINTLPYKLGVKNARILALFAMLLSEAGAVILFFSDVISGGLMVGYVLGSEAASFFIYRSTPKKPDLFFSFGVEGTSIVLFLMVFIFNYFWP